jgi:hypothetical protein
MINVWNYCFEGYASQARNGGLRWPFKRGWEPEMQLAQGLARVGSKKIEVEQRAMTAMMAQRSGRSHWAKGACARGGEPAVRTRELESLEMPPLISYLSPALIVWQHQQQPATRRQ